MLLLIGLGDMARESRGENHYNAKLTDEDVEQIRELMEWKKEEIARLNSIASCSALAEKFGVSKSTIEKIGTYRIRRARALDISYCEKKSEETRQKMSASKIAKDDNPAGEYTRKTGIEAISVIMDMAKTHTKTEVAVFFGWKYSRDLSSWMDARGYSVEFKKHKPIPPKRKGWGSIDLSRKSHQPKLSGAQHTL